VIENFWSVEMIMIQSAPFYRSNARAKHIAKVDHGESSRCFIETRKHVWHHSTQTRTLT